jgi:2-aminoethylphosphonate-pyruvate transaminase
VILAAGRGTRLGARGTETPKGFLRLGARPIVEESLAKLVAEGIERVVIVTGHLAEFYEGLRARHAGLVVTVHNARYAESGSMVSLACARELVRGDFLLLESDLVYEQRALRILLDDERPDVLLLSGPTGAGDEVWVEAPGERLVAMSKDRARLNSVAGELVGLTKVSAALFARMLAALAATGRLTVDYETDALVAAARERPVACRLVADLVWAEIDDERHLQRARERVYPALLAGARELR